VEVEDEVRPVRHLEPFLPPGKSLRLVLGQLLKEVGHVDDDTVADERHAVGPDDARGEQVKVVFLLAHYDSVPGVVAALKRIIEEEAVRTTK
jgi:hypothetical protein